MTLEERVHRLEKATIQLQYLTLLHGDLLKGRDEKNSIAELGELVSQIASEHAVSTDES